MRQGGGGDDQGHFLYSFAANHGAVQINQVLWRMEMI